MNMNVRKREKSPDFVVGSFGCKFGDLEPFVNSKGYINFDLLKGKEEGSLYVKVSEYGLDKEEKPVTNAKEIDITDDEISF